MTDVIEWTWFFSLLALTGYYMIIFRRPVYPKVLPYLEWPGVSVVIAHQNDVEFLEKNIRTINSQDYPLFEIIIVDDHSSAEQKSKLNSLQEQFTKLKVLATDIAGKKNALNTGIQSAQFELILVTDADCQPLSDQWIKKMVLSGRGAQVVLGYSPYRKKNGWLNLLIRFETVMTAIQYLSWAGAGKPYMGVGRNMMYSRSLFQRVDPYKTPQSIPFGDDDLWIQEASRHARVKVCDDQEAHVITEPSSTWKEWLRQKHRHMSAGYFYNKGSWLKPGIFGIVLVMHWLLIPFLVMGSYWWKWFPVFLIALVIRWIKYGSWTQRLGEKDSVIWYPILEINYALYLGITSVYTMFNRKRTWSR